MALIASRCQRMQKKNYWQCQKKKIVKQILRIAFCKNVLKFLIVYGVFELLLWAMFPNVNEIIMFINMINAFLEM